MSLSLQTTTLTRGSIDPQGKWKVSVEYGRLYRTGDGLYWVKCPFCGKLSTLAQFQVSTTALVTVKGSITCPSCSLRYAILNSVVSAV